MKEQDGDVLLKQRLGFRAGKKQGSCHVEKEKLSVILQKAGLWCKDVCSAGESALHTRNAQVPWGAAGKATHFSVNFWSKGRNTCV